MIHDPLPGSAAHRWEWDEDAATGADYGYCLNRCGTEWRDGDPEPTAPCVPQPKPTEKWVIGNGE